MARGKIIYSRGFPYGAPLVMIRGGATRDPEVKAALQGIGFAWDGGTHAWQHYMHAEELAAVLTTLADYGCEVLAKTNLDDNYVIDGFERRA